MRNYRAQKRKEAEDRKRAEKMKVETKTPTSRHIWVPSSIDFSCKCNNEGCIEVWPEEAATAPKTSCPTRKSENT
jgi:hypothetical protein